MVSTICEKLKCMDLASYEEYSGGINNEDFQKLWNSSNKIDKLFILLVSKYNFRILIPVFFFLVFTLFYLPVIVINLDFSNIMGGLIVCIYSFIVMVFGFFIEKNQRKLPINHLIEKIRSMPPGEWG